MKRKELNEMIDRVVSEMLTEFVLNTQKLYKPKVPHLQKYRKSRYHPDEVDKQDKLKAIKKNNIIGANPFREPAYDIAPNVRLFLNTTLEAIPKSETSTKILHGVPVDKPEAMALARMMMALPGFPFQQPRKLMNLLILLAAENKKHS